MEADRQTAHADSTEGSGACRSGHRRASEGGDKDDEEQYEGKGVCAAAESHELRQRRRRPVLLHTTERSLLQSHRGAMGSAPKQ